MDRITPAADASTTSRVHDVLGIDCAAPVQAEDFYQWVVEDRFANGRPAWENVQGVTFVDDVSEYESMKLRLLNGSHTVRQLFFGQRQCHRNKEFKWRSYLVLNDTLSHS